MRILEYAVNSGDSAVCIGDVLRHKLKLSDKEISHAKNFFDGIRVKLEKHTDEELEKLLSGEPYFFEKNRIISELHKRKALLSGKIFRGDVPDEEGFLRANTAVTLFEGDRIRIAFHEMEDDAGRIIAVKGEIDILYEDGDIIILNKPGGIASHPSPGHKTDTLANRLAYYFEDKNEPHRIRIVGRLDKDASGVLLFAKTRMAARFFKINPESYEKEYLALCHGVFAENEKGGRITYPILKKPEILLKRMVHPLGQRAATDYEVEREFEIKDSAFAGIRAAAEKISLVRLRIETGRTHQIRVHMAAIGHPLLGDPLYNMFDVHEGRDRVNFREPDSKEFIQSQFGMRRATLHAEKLTVIHPVSKDKITIRAGLPEDMRKIYA